MQFLLEVICRCDAAADIDFISIMAAEGIKVVTTIGALLDAAYPTFSCIVHKVNFQGLMYFPCVYVEVGTAKWRAYDSLSYEVALEVYGAARGLLSPHDV